MSSAIQRGFLPSPEPGRQLFSDLPPEAAKDFDQIKSLASFPRGTVLFREGEWAGRVMVLCRGRVKLSVCSESGQRLTLHVAGPGEVLGLSAALTRSAHEMTAEVLDNAQVAMVERADLLPFLRDHRQVCLQAAKLLSQDLHQAYERVRTVGLMRTRRPRVHTH